MKKLFTHLALLLFLSFHACKQSPVQDVLPTNPAISTPYRHYKINSKKSELGFAVIDTQRREIAYAFGKKGANGDLLTISNLYYYSQKNKVSLIVKFSADYLITEINIFARNEHRLLRYDGYDLGSGKVNVELIDKNTNTVITPKRQIAFSSGSVENIRRFQQANLTSAKGGRLADLCLTQANMVHLALSYTGCALSISYTAISLASGVGALLGAASIAGTLLSCVETINDFREFFDGKCAETDLDDGAQTIVGCALAIITRTSWDDLLDCAAGIADDVTGLLFPPDPNREKEDPTSGRESTGSSTGDPHLTTTDKGYYSFQGHGEFVAVKSTTDNFEVQVRQEDVKNTGIATLNTAVAVQTGTDVVCVTAEKDWLYINGKVQDLNFNRIRLAGNAYILKTVNQSLNTFDIVTDNGDVVRVRFHNSYLLDYILYLKDNRKGKVIGLLGDYNGDRNNDLRVRDGAYIKSEFNQLYPSFANSWRIHQSQSLFYYPSGKSTETYTRLNFPRSPTTLSIDAVRQAQEVCKNAGVKGEPFLSNCVFDVAVTNDRNLANSSVWAERGNPVASSFGRKFSITDFANPPMALDVKVNAQIVGSTAEINYKSNYPSGVLGSSLAYDLSNGFETTYEFSGQTDMYLQVSAIMANQSYNPLGIGALNGTTVFQAVAHTKIIENKSLPSLFDGNKHKVKIIWRNKSVSGTEFLVFVDDLEKPVYHTENQNILSLYEYLTVTSQSENALRQINLLAFNNPAKDAKVIIYNWAFTPL